MNRMEIRGKTYCEISPEVWQQCPVNREMSAPGPDGIYLGLILFIAIGGAIVEVRKARIRASLSNAQRSLNNA